MYRAKISILSIDEFEVGLQDVRCKGGNQIAI